MTARAFQIFAAGTHQPMQGGPVTFDDGDLRQIAAGYQPNEKPAKLVLGHPDQEREDYGEVRHVIAQGGALFALAEVKDELVDWVRRGLYTAVSASLLPSGHPENPLTAGWYLRHVGFLGAQRPSVKGMQPIAFAEPESAARALDFAAPSGTAVDPGRLRLYHAAKELQAVVPGMTFIAAASLAERALVR